MRECTAAATLLIDVAGYLERQGVSSSDLCQALRIDRSILGQPNARVPASLIERLWVEGARLSGDNDLGLHTAENHNPGTLNILGYVLLNCHTARQALDRLVHYAALLNDGLRVKIRDESGHTHCLFGAIETAGNYLLHAPRQPMEAMACGTVVTISRLTTSHVEPLAVTFRHPSPPRVEEHLRLLGPSVRFGQPHNSVVYPTQALGASLISANAQLLEMFETQARLLLAELDQRGATSRRVLDILAHRIVVAAPSLGDVAAELGVSDRSLQRELQLEGTTFRQLVEDVRRELAVQHLARPGASASDAAFLLGFSELSAFTRAFRRWTGVPPTQFRAAGVST